MNLYLIWQTTNQGWDTYDCAVVIAENEIEAHKIVPGNDPDSWVSPADVHVELLGPYTGPARASPIVSSSYNAG
jgi:hypothetical protein